MRPPRYNTDRLQQFLRQKKVSLLTPLRTALGNPAAITVFRKLKSLRYLSSYTHAGKYYTLPEIAQFNDQGLWSWHDIRFSRYRTLKRTVEHWVTGSKSGYFESELAQELKVQVRVPLLRLLQHRLIDRERISGRYLYCAADPLRHRQQALARHHDAGHVPGGPEVLQHELKAAIVLFWSLLNQQQRRLYAGLESLKTGQGGDQKISELLGLNAVTVARGRRDLLAGEVVADRARKKGGGRKPLEKKRRP